MHDTASLLDAAKARHAVPSDYKLALLLGIEPSAVRHYRKGRSRPDDEIAERLAELAGLDAGYVVACIHAERAANEHARGIWTRIAERLKEGSTAALTVILSALFLGGWSQDSRAATRGYADAPAQLRELTDVYIVARARQVARTCVRWICRALIPLTARPALA